MGMLRGCLFVCSICFVIEDIEIKDLKSAEVIQVLFWFHFLLFRIVLWRTQLILYLFLNLIYKYSHVFHFVSFSANRAKFKMLIILSNRFLKELGGGMYTHSQVLFEVPKLINTMFDARVIWGRPDLNYFNLTCGPRTVFVKFATSITLV